MKQLNWYQIFGQTHTIPDGRTVTPTDDIQIWLNCANIWDKAYTTLNEVLADTTTLSALMASNNAVDYMVRSTTWVSDITANQTAMSYIGLNNYCADTLLDDDTNWLNPICNSVYFESVLNAKVPTMTSETAPSGQIIHGTSDGSLWYGTVRPFSNSTSPAYTPNLAGTSGKTCWIGYKFDEPVRVVRFQSTNGNNTSEFPATMIIKYSKIQISEDGINWEDLTSTIYNPTTVGYQKKVIFGNPHKYMYYREFITETHSPGLNGTKSGLYMQFYGRQDV